MKILAVEAPGLEARHIKRPDLCENIHSIIEDGMFEALDCPASITEIEGAQKSLCSLEEIARLDHAAAVLTVAPAIVTGEGEYQSVRELDAIIGDLFELCKRTGRAIVGWSSHVESEPVFFPA